MNMDHLLETMADQAQRIREIYFENGKNDYDAGRIAGYLEALELVEEVSKEVN